MFGLRKAIQVDPAKIATAVTAVATDGELLAECYAVFATSPDLRKRVNFSAVLFVYCCGRYWASSKDDARVLAACEQAADLIPQRLKDPNKFVRVGDYLASRYEAARLSLLLESHFQQRIPFPEGVFADSVHVNAAMNKVVQNYEIHLSTLAKAAILLRQQQFADTMQRAAEIKDPDVTFMLLAANFDEQVSGVTLSDTASDPRLTTDQQMRALRGSIVLRNYCERIMVRLAAM